MSKRSILIDPYTRNISEVFTDGGGEAIKNAMSGPEHTVDLFTVLDLGGDQTLYLDDEGLLFAGRFIWRLKGYPNPLAGRGLILGTDEEGDSIPTRLTVPEVRAMVEWTDLETSGDMTAGHEGVSDVFGMKDVPTYFGGTAITQPKGTHAAAQAQAGVDWARIEREETRRDPGGLESPEDVD